MYSSLQNIDARSLVKERNSFSNSILILSNNRILTGQAHIIINDETSAERYLVLER